MSSNAQPAAFYQAPGPKSPGAHSRSFSLGSDKSGGSKLKEDLTESPKDKQRRDSIWKSTSKANPNAAINEAQPGVNAILEESTIANLRGVQHKDAFGNIITDPDLSNPTRPRMERPLDTIRAFEKAIDNGYKRRSNYVRSESSEQVGQHSGSRRNSAYGYDSGPSPSRFSNGNGNGGGYYGGQQRPDGFAPGPSGPPRRFPNQRMASDPNLLSGQRPYPPQHGHQFSQDTVNTGMSNGSDSTGPWANSTDPSSENSSIDRVQAAPKPYENGYGPNGYQGPIPENGAYPMKGGAMPVQSPPGQRRPIPLGNSSNTTELPTTKRPEPEKRKSWLKRRFSKKD